MIALAWLGSMVPMQKELIIEQNQSFNKSLTKQISSLLLSIDKKHFQALTIQQPDDHYFCYENREKIPSIYLQTFNQLDERYFLMLVEVVIDYFIQKQYKKPKKHFQKLLIESKSYQQLLNLVLYLSVTSPIKNISIQVILKFSEQQQSKLMEIVKNIENNMQSLVQMRKIVEKIEKIIQDNDLLRQKCEEGNAENCRYLNLIKQFQGQNNIVSSYNNLYLQEKKNALLYTKFENLKEYFIKCKKIKDQNEVLLVSIENYQSTKHNIQLTNQELKKILQIKGKNITNHYEQLEKLKQNCRFLRYQNNKYEVYNHIVQKIPLLPLEDNTKRRNISSNKIDFKYNKAQTDRTNCSMQLYEDENSFEQTNNLGMLLEIKNLQIEELKMAKILENMKLLNLQNKNKYIYYQQRMRKIINQHNKCMNIFEKTKIF